MNRFPALLVRVAKAVALLPILLTASFAPAIAQSGNQPSASPQTSSELAVVVTNARNARGYIHVDICPESTFLKPCPYSAQAPARPGMTRVIVHGVPRGQFAAQIFHDENGNREVDRGLFGIPTEGIGFSNSVRVRFRAPRFSEAAFTVTGRDQTIAIELQYFGGARR